MVNQKSMLAVDFRRMFTMPRFFIILGTAVVIPILVLVMTTMMGGADMGADGFTNTWQMIGSTSGSDMGMSIIAMCNINLVFFLLAVLICPFIAEDFTSGYAKNLFTIRSKKRDYVVSKLLVGFVSGTLLLLGFFAGSVIGGAISGLSFEIGSVFGLICSMIAKIGFSAVFVAIYVLMSVIAKQKTWLSVLLSLGAGMLLFTMIPMMTPLDSGIMNVALCLAGGVMFSLGLGAISNTVLKKKDILG